jgi:hypothetical protein
VELGARFGGLPLWAGVPWKSRAFPDDGLAEQMAVDEPVPVGHRDGPPLYGRMMKAISSGHTFGNRVRMLKLPLIFADERLWAGAITQFFWLSEMLEARLEAHSSHPMVQRVRALGLCVTPGYAADLKALYGDEWRAAASAARTSATAAYVADLESADPVSLVAASFILYGVRVASPRSRSPRALSQDTCAARAGSRRGRRQGHPAEGAQSLPLVRASAL